MDLILSQIKSALDLKKGNLYLLACTSQGRYYILAGVATAEGTFLCGEGTYKRRFDDETIIAVYEVPDAKQIIGFPLTKRQTNQAEKRLMTQEPQTDSSLLQNAINVWNAWLDYDAETTQGFSVICKAIGRMKNAIDKQQKGAV